MANILPEYTLCQVIIHTKQDFSIRLRKPLDVNIARVKEVYSFQEAKLDNEGDFTATGGNLRESPNVKLRDVTLYSSQNRLSVDVVGGKTTDAVDALESMVSTLYGLLKTDIALGTEYIEYKTVTKAQFINNLDGLFSLRMQEIIKSWRSFETEKIVAKLREKMSDGTHGIISISNDYYERLYKGQKDIFVAPTEISFHIWIPTKYYRMTKHQIKIQVRSFEDFSDNLFFRLYARKCGLK